MFDKAAQLPFSARFLRKVSDFRSDERGGVAIFVVFLFVMMVLFGGIAVDVMRFEWRRVTLQQTMDRAMLAAANLVLPPSQTPESVAQNWFDAAGLGDELTVDYTAPELTGVLTDASRTVSGKARVRSYNHFMHMLDVPYFDAPVRSGAQQGATKVEVVLVLDISGSMLNNNRAVNLKIAAKEFVDLVLGSDTENRVSISMVPFNGQVNLGPALASRFNVTHPNGAANVDCVDMPASVYSSITHSRTLPMPATAHADTYSNTSTSTSYVAIEGHQVNSSGVRTNNWCPPEPGNIIRVMNDNVASLKAQIDGLNVVGATSINAGLRWGLNLIDPAQRPLINELISAGVVSPVYAGRPYDWTDPEAIKYIILMTDGEHFPEDRVNTAFKAGLSPIYYNSTTNLFVIQHTNGRPAAAGSRQFWQPNLCTSTACRNGSNTSEAWLSSVPSGYVQQTWPQVWARARMKWVAWQLYARALGTDSTTRNNAYTSALNAFRMQTSSTDMDTQLRTLCDLAKERNVLIYGIAFEAPVNGENAIRNCVSSPQSTFYFDVNGLEIRSAFQTIASNIGQLRLTQ